METEKLPERIIFIGSGYISLEFAHVARRAMSEVTILHRSERLLRHFDADMVNMLVKASEAAGIKILTNKPVAGVEKGAITVDKHMRTSNPRIYAGGDCASGGVQLVPVAALQGEVAASNILNENSVEVDYTGIPSAVHSIPVLASVGTSASNDSNKYKVIFRNRSSWHTTREAEMRFAASKVIIDEANDRIIGAYILGPNAGEAINIFAAVMRLGLKASDIKKLVFSYPTTCSDIQRML